MITTTVKPIMTIDSISQEEKNELMEKNIFFVLENFFMSDIINEIVNPKNMNVSIELFFEKEIDNVQIYILTIHYRNEKDSIIVPGYLLSSNPYDKEFIEFISKNKNIILPILNYATDKNEEIKVIDKPFVYQFNINEEMRSVAKNIKNAKPGIIFSNLKSQISFLEEHEYPNLQNLFYLLNKEEIEGEEINSEEM